MGGWQVNPQERHEVEVKNRDGETGTVWLRELSERDVRAKNAKMIQFNRKSGDAGSAKVRLEAIRAYEMEMSIVDWDFTDENGEKLEINRKSINLLPQSIANQIHEKIMDLNELPQDQEEDEEDEDEEYEDYLGDDPSDDDHGLDVEPNGEVHEFRHPTSKVSDAT